MIKPSKQRVTKEMLAALRGQSSPERILHRLHSVTLVLKGFSSSAVGALFGDSPRAVAYWVKRFKEGGMKGLEDESRPGRPSKLSALQLKSVQTFLEQSRVKAKPVNAEVLRDFLAAKHRIALTPRQCWRILKKLKT
jgi:transposase